MASQQGEWGSLPSSDTEMNKLVKSIDESQKSVNKVREGVTLVYTPLKSLTVST